MAVHPSPMPCGPPHTQQGARHAADGSVQRAQIEDELQSGSGPHEATFALFSSFPERLDAIIESRGSAAVSGVSGDLSSHGGASLRQVGRLDSIHLGWWSAKRRRWRTDLIEEPCDKIYHDLLTIRTRFVRFT